MASDKIDTLVNAQLSAAAAAQIPVEAEHAFERDAMNMRRMAGEADVSNVDLNHRLIQSENPTPSNIFGGTETIQDFKFHEDIHILRDARLKFSLSAAVSGCLPVPRWVNRVEWIVDGQVKQTVYGETALHEILALTPHERVLQEGTNLNVDASGDYARSTTAPGAGTVYMPLHGLLTGFTASPGLFIKGIPNSDLRIRVYYASAVTVVAGGTEPAVTSVELEVVEERQAAGDAQALMEAYMSADGVHHRTLHSQTNAYSNIQQWDGSNTVTQQLTSSRGISPGVLVYVRKADETTAPATDRGVYYNVQDVQLTDQAGADILQKKDQQFMRRTVFPKHFPSRVMSGAGGDFQAVWIPFAKDLGAALEGVHTGWRPLSGREILKITSADDFSGDAPYVQVVTYQYADLMVKGGRLHYSIAQ